MENCILGASKKINKLSKEKNCDLVDEWKQSIVNHMYWWSSSTPPDQPDLKIAKWLSIVNHIANKHSGHEDPLYPKCTHARLSRQCRKRHKWFEPSKYKNAYIY